MAQSEWAIDAIFSVVFLLLCGSAFLLPALQSRKDLIKNNFLKESSTNSEARNICYPGSKKGRDIRMVEC
jgi:hypothetical protein